MYKEAIGRAMYLDPIQSDRIKHGKFSDFKKVGLFFNQVGGEMKGLQIGFLNLADSLDGVQIGFLNFTNKKNPLGFCPIVNASF